MKKICSLFLLLALTNTANAAVNGLSIHSRANCVGFNESVTWDARWYRTYSTVSDHFYQNKGGHEINLPWEDTWRSAAYHSREAWAGAGWRVIGSHWMKDERTRRDIFLGKTEATDCSIYDGWWDR